MYCLTSDKKSWVYVCPGFLKSDEASFEEMMSERPGDRHVIQMFGKDVQLPRYTQSYGKDYSFSGAVSKSKPWIPVLEDIRDKTTIHLKKVLPEDTNVDFNMSLVNWYLSGDQYIGPHSDDERPMVVGSPVATLSWGSGRTFVIEPKKDQEGKKMTFEVKDGDLLVMGGSLQKTHKHSVPKTKTPVSTRISFTFRVFR